MCEIIHRLLSPNSFYSLKVQNQLSICSLQLLKHSKVFLLLWLKRIIYSNVLCLWKLRRCCWDLHGVCFQAERCLTRKSCTILNYWSVHFSVDKWQETEKGSWSATIISRLWFRRNTKSATINTYLQGHYIIVQKLVRQKIWRAGGCYKERSMFVWMELLAVFFLYVPLSLGPKQKMSSSVSLRPMFWDVSFDWKEQVEKWD